jgi:hypothetical protein
MAETFVVQNLGDSTRTSWTWQVSAAHSAADLGDDMRIVTFLAEGSPVDRTLIRIGVSLKPLGSGPFTHRQAPSSASAGIARDPSSGYRSPDLVRGQLNCLALDT